MGPQFVAEALAPDNPPLKVCSILFKMTLLAKGRYFLFFFTNFSPIFYTNAYHVMMILLLYQVVTDRDGTFYVSIILVSFTSNF